MTTSLIENVSALGRNRRRYRADRGGHAPGHLREAFAACLASYECGETKEFFDALGDEETLSFWDPRWQWRWNEMTINQRAHWLTGQLWNCCDVLPSMACDYLDLPSGSTYAVAVRQLRAKLEAAK